MVLREVEAMSEACEADDLEELGFESVLNGRDDHLRVPSSCDYSTPREPGTQSGAVDGACEGSGSPRLTNACNGGCSAGCATSCSPASEGRTEKNVAASESGRAPAETVSAQPGDADEGAISHGIVIRIKDQGANLGPLCAKCRVNPAELIANQREPYCGECLRHSLLYRFKTAVNKHALIQAHDAVLLAFSGGHASTVLLHFLSEIQSHATTAAAAAADRGKTIFWLGLLFVSEAAVLPRPNQDGVQEVDRIRQLAAPFEERGCRVHIVGLEQLFVGAGGNPRGAGERGTVAQAMVEDTAATTPECGEGERRGEFLERPGVEESERREDRLKGAQERLRAVVGGVKDATAQEDLVEMLRGEVMQQVAAAHGYTKIVTGLCASRLAARVLTGTIKGRGFSLPADLQHVDRRRAVPLVAPLRDCVIKELAILCKLNRWPTTFVPSLDAGPHPRPSLNRLTHDFLTVIEDDLPGRTHTILRTAGKLQPFPFNTFPALPPGHRARLQPAQDVGPASHPATGIRLCALCHAPLSEAERAETEQGRKGAGGGGHEKRGQPAQLEVAGGEEVESGAHQDGEAEAAGAVGRTGAGRGGEPDERGEMGTGGGAEGSPCKRAPPRDEAPGRMLQESAADQAPPAPAPTVRPGRGVESLEPDEGPACCRSCREQVVDEERGGGNPGLLSSLPWVGQERAARQQAAGRARMRKELGDFLLADGES